MAAAAVAYSNTKNWHVGGAKFAVLNADITNYNTGGVSFDKDDCGVGSIQFVWAAPTEFGLGFQWDSANSKLICLSTAATNSTRFGEVTTDTDCGTWQIFVLGTS